MHISAAGMQEQPFPTNGPPVSFVHYQSQQQAHRFLQSVLTDDRGVGLLYGPESSGKTAVIDHFVNVLPEDIAVAVVDAMQLEKSSLFASALSQFGYNIPFDSPDDLMNMIRVFVVQQARTNQAPLLIIENIDRLSPKDLRALCKLATETVHRRYAVKVILVSRHPLHSILNSVAMEPISTRLMTSFELEPMNVRETLNYLYSKLRASGITHPDSILTMETCDELHIASGGWPGALDHLTRLAIEQADSLPVQYQNVRSVVEQDAAGHAISSTSEEQSEEPPLLFITLNGKTLQEKAVQDAKTSIGRSELCDICIKDRFMSKFHALLIRNEYGITLVDLNSANGIYVNSRRISSVLLRDLDIISIGNHRIKIMDPSSHAKSELEVVNPNDTANMKNIEDMRRTAASEDLPVLTDIEWKS